MKKVIDREKRSKKLSEVSQSKTYVRLYTQFSRDKSMQKEVLPSHKLQGHAYE